MYNIIEAINIYKLHITLSEPHTHTSDIIVSFTPRSVTRWTDKTFFSFLELS